jgi:hypothetical protein
MGSNTLGWSTITSSTIENTSVWSILEGAGRLELPPHELKHSTTAIMSSEKIPVVELRDEEDKSFIRNNANLRTLIITF